MTDVLRTLSFKGRSDNTSTFTAIDDNDTKKSIDIRVSDLGETDLHAFCAAIRCRKWLEDDTSKLQLRTHHAGSGMAFVSWGGQRDGIELNGRGHLIFSSFDFYRAESNYGGYDSRDARLQVDLSDCDAVELERVVTCLLEGLGDPTDSSAEPQAVHEPL